ncbi:receptor-like protein Cf-9 homolog [Solanum lycopersicum]|uniref:receptor-like protein Cf-9 homolog n=1 Tax=Solanum lycopersicum TaxID=4081 RepID=UPI00374950CD
MGIGELALFLLYAFLCQLVFSSSLPHLCPDEQAVALLQFKNMFTINLNASYGVSYPKTVTWNKSADCCSWDGVHCDEMTGQVTKLDLANNRLRGEFHSNSSLFKLTNLKWLDLSGNNFSGSLISPKFGELSSLTHLDLSYSNFTSIIPSEISRLSKLHVLRLHDSQLRFEPHNFELLLKNLTRLRELHLSDVNISSAIPLNFSSYLTNLRLWNTQIYGTLPEGVFHLSNLESLDLSDTPQLTVRFPTTKWNSSASLVELVLLRVNVAGRIPESFGHLTSLQKLDLRSCNLSGSIPKPLWNLTNIEVLNLGDNHLEGTISDFFRFGKLWLLSLGNNNFSGRLEFLSSNRSWTQLEFLDFSFNSLTGPIPSNVSGLQNLDSLGLSSNQLNGTIPSWIFSLSSLEFLDFSFNSLTGPIPSNVSGLQNLNSLRLSSNQLNGTIPSWIFSLPSLSQLDLSDNHFSGNIQEFKSKILVFVSVKQNQLQGPIPKSLLNRRNLYSLFLSHNNLSGQIPSTICNQKTLEVLDLGSNNLEGTVPLCLGEMSDLWLLDLSNNRLRGTIDTTFSIGNRLTVIKFNKNKLEGKVPQSLINCTYLEVVDLGNNELNDTFPKWLGALYELQILNLRSNKFFGPIKVSRTDNLFAQIRIMDLSSNGFSGHLPVSLFKKFEVMKITSENSGTREYVGDIFYYYTYSLIVTTKGLELELPRVLTTEIIINLSRNRFEGNIPSIIGDLIALRTLNLSHNRLEGHIPASLHQLSVLESLDLSSNKISGEIPQQLVSLKSLEVLNLSHNHLVGCIPKGNQFDTFENSSYQGNDGLRGFPLSKDCGVDEGVPEATTPFELDEEEDSPMISWQAVLMGYGCGLVIGLSIIYIMLSTQYPAWFSRMDVKLEHIIITRMKKHKKRY